VVALQEAVQLGQAPLVLVMWEVLLVEAVWRENRNQSALLEE